MADCCITPDLSLCTQGPCCSTAPDPSPALQAIAAELALSYLWSATGRRFARTCEPITVRPCKPETCKPNSVQDIIYWEANRAGDGSMTMGVLSFTPTLIDGSAYNIGCGCPKACCTCKADCEVLLPGPVCEIIDVVVSGVHLGKNSYTVYDHNKLVFRNVGIQVSMPITAPLPAGIMQVTAFPLSAAGCGASLDAIGSTYQFEMTGGNQQDLQFIVEIPVGNLSTELSFFQPQGFDWIVLDGGNPTITHPTSSKIIVGPPTIPDTNVRLLIRAPRGDTNGARSIVINQGGLGAQPVRLCEVQYSDFSTGSGYCPPCQDYNKPLGEEGTWSVTYTYGEKWPVGAAQIAGLLACEFGQILAGQDTGLPANVQSLVRQGISIELPNPFELIKLGLTGNKLIDLWIRSQNPAGLSQRSRVWSPDLPITRRET